MLVFLDGFIMADWITGQKQNKICRNLVDVSEMYPTRFVEKPLYLPSSLIKYCQINASDQSL